MRSLFLLEQVEKAVFVVLENAESIQLLLQFKSLRAVFPGLCEQLLDALRVGRGKPLFLGGLGTIAFVVRRALLSVRLFDLRKQLAQAVLHDLGLFGQLGEIELDAGQVFINNYGAGGGIELPFGGVKGSGFGREKGFVALHEFSVLKTVAIQHG